MDTGLAVGIDVGATKLAAGLVGGDGTVISRLRRDTPSADPAAISRLVVDVVDELTRDQGLSGLPVGLGAAGMVDRDGAVRYAPNIAWADYPLRAELEGLLAVPVAVDNDANVAAWAEYCCGAGRDASSSMLMLTLGTGVGGGLVHGGELVRGANGLAGEVGHIIVSEGGPLCGCGNHGCLEALASGTAIGRRAQERLDAGTLPADSALSGREELSGKTVTVAAHAGDDVAGQILAEAGFWLGVGLASLVNACDPQVVVIGGGAMQAGELLLAPARESFGARVLGRAHRRLPEIVRAELADDGGLVGAGLLALLAAHGPGGGA